MDERPLDPDDPVLPPKHRERWLKRLEALQPRMPQELTEAELRAAWGADLAEWFKCQTRKKQHP
jgi:hypothetical protein